MTNRLILLVAFAACAASGRVPAAAPDLEVLSGVVDDFNAGLKALKAQAPDKALESLKRVAQSTNTPPDVRNLADWFLIDALAKSGRQAEARDAAKRFFLVCPVGDLRTAAFQSFRKLGGQDADVLPKETPSAMLLRFSSEAGDRHNPNLKTAAEFRSHASSKILDFLDMVGGRGIHMMDPDHGDPEAANARVIAEMLRELMRECQVSRETIAIETGTAETILDAKGRLIVWTSVVSTNGWILTDMEFRVSDAMRAQMARRGELPPAMSASRPSTQPAANAKPAAPVDENTRREIETLIGRLGDRDSAVRADARSRLKELGDKARPFLEQARRNPDPEISQSAKQLLAE